MKTIFDQIDINGMSLKNRLVRSATWERMANDDGHMNERLMAIYEKLAEGDVGMIITGYAFVTNHEQPNPRMMGICDDSFIDDYRALTSMVHNHGSKIIMQLAYGGSSTRYQTESRIIWGASAVAHPRTGVMPIAMEQRHIDMLIDAFAAAAVRAKKAGFDGVELHGAHGYLLSQFLSPFYNRRTDKYGGDLANRLRLICEVYEESRSRVGEDFNILIKLNCSDFSDGGFTFNEAQAACRTFDQLGFNAIEISGPTPPGTNPDAECVLADYAATIAEQVRIPIIVVNKNRDPNLMNRILNETKIAFFSMSRPLIYEPSLVQRWARGDMQKAKCISCGKCYNENGIKCVFTNN